MAAFRTYYFLLLCLFSFFSGISQQDYAHPKKSRKNDQLIKINVSAMLRADYALSYETRIREQITLEGTLGATCYTPFLESVDFFNYHPANCVAAKRKYSIQPSVKLGTRYYFDYENKEITGSYVCVEGMFRRYGYEVKNFDSPSFTKEYSDQKEIRLLWGTQNNDISNAAFYDCSIGFGYRFHERKYLGYTEASKFSRQELFTGNRNYLVFVINLKVGFAINNQHR